MSLQKIESVKVGKRRRSMTHKCTFVSDATHEVMVGSAVCLKCSNCKGKVSTPNDGDFIDCKFRRTWA